MELSENSANDSSTTLLVSSTMVSSARTVVEMVLLNETTTIPSAISTFFPDFPVNFTRHVPLLRMAKITPLPEISGHPSLVVPFAEWESARKVYSFAWDLHCFGIGGLFALVAFYSFVCTIQLFRLPVSRREHGYFSLLHTVIFLFGVSRAVFLMLDPYNFHQILPRSIAAVFLHIAFPCLITAFSMILAALVRATDPKAYSSRIINGYALFGMIFFNFALAITAELIVDFWLTSAEIGAFVVATQTYFIAWSVGLSLGYFVMFGSLLSAARETDASDSGPAGTRRVTAGLRITMFSAILLLIFGGLQAFGLISVHGYFGRRAAPVDPWIWYGFHSACRITELIIVALLAFVTSLVVWTHSQMGLNILSRSVSPENVERRQQLLPDQTRTAPPGSPSLVPRNRRDFPVTFNPDGVKSDGEDFFTPRFAVNRQRNNTGGRKVDSHLLESNPIHVSDEDRFG